MKQSDDSHFIPMTSVHAGDGVEVRPDVFYYTNQIVNVVMIGTPGSEDWVLIDAGMPGASHTLHKVAEKRFGENNPPSAIVLTHGHFDHVGSLVGLLKEWNVPVFAHPLEFPFLSGDMDYPEPDKTVEGGMLAKIASIYPNEAIDISESLQPLPGNGTLPFFEEWKWIHVPGHSPGQVAFFREKDRMLISADAIITVRQDMFYKVLLQKKEINGPPRYFTTDWDAAKQSVNKLAALNPDIMITGHGSHMEGDELKQGLEYLINNFDEVALPKHGKFVRERK